MTKMNTTMKESDETYKYMIAPLMTVYSDSQVVIYEEKLIKNISPGS